MDSLTKRLADALEDMLRIINYETCGDVNKAEIALEEYRKAVEDEQKD